MPDAGRVAPISGSVWCLSFVLEFCDGVCCLSFVMAFVACVRSHDYVLADCNILKIRVHCITAQPTYSATRQYSRFY